jgi:DNA-binding NtrC family response regulator
LGVRGRTVLVVDDDASIRFLCRVNLEFDGWTVRDAASLDDARAALGDDLALVLLDVHVGNASGVAFLEELRRDRPGLPVVMLTGSFGATTSDDSGADAVIAKPFKLDDFLETVARVAR